MSLFALYKNNSSPTRAEIDDALAGNLCRCTGYRPIISAAGRMYDYGQDLIDERKLGRQLEDIHPAVSLKPAAPDSSRIEARGRYFCSDNNIRTGGIIDTTP